MKQFTNFEFHMPTKIIFGIDAAKQVGELIGKQGGTRALVVMDCGKYPQKDILHRAVTDSLDAAGIAHWTMDGVQPNPRRSYVYECLELARAEKVDFIVAVGGGSASDTAKAVALAMEYDGDVWDFFCWKAVPQKMAPLCVISTIAATGSDTSGAAVVFDDMESHMKWPIFAGCNPLFAVLDPQLTYSVPPYQTAAGSADIFSHSFDNYFTYGTSYVGDGLAESVMRAALKFGPIALQKPEDYEARAELLLAATLSNNGISAIGRSGVSGGAHNLERILSSKYDCAHGAGIAVVMPALLQYLLDHDETTVPKLAQFATRVMGVASDPLNPSEVAQCGIDKLREWIKGMGLPLTINELTHRDIHLDVAEELADSLIYIENDYMLGFGHCKREDAVRIFESVIAE